MYIDFEEESKLKGGFNNMTELKKAGIALLLATTLTQGVTPIYSHAQDAVSLTATTEDVHTLVEQSALARGASRPSANASTHNIGVSAYNYQVQRVGAAVFTDKLLTGKTSMRITANNWKCSVSHGLNTSNQLTLTVFNSSGSQVATRTVTVHGGSASHTFTGLNRNTKYYVRFSVPTNGNIYSFNGAIS
jgi:hypothetical protein